MQAVSDHIASLSELNELAETLSFYAQTEERESAKFFKKLKDISQSAVYTVPSNRSVNFMASS